MSKIPTEVKSSGYDSIPMIKHTNPDGTVMMVRAYSLPSQTSECAVFDDGSTDKPLTDEPEYRAQDWPHLDDL